jgi:hypothetical protein
VGQLADAVARLDALAALHRRDELEEEAAPFLQPVEPFALGIVRVDGALIEQATARFEAMGLDWHAAETRRLAGGR